MTAYPKIDPETGEMLMFANFPHRDFVSGALELYVADAQGVMCDWSKFEKAHRGYHEQSCH
jgi:carotenoid cleavage dioxygenase-like enzyme